MYKEDLALNNLQWLICHKTKPNQTKPPPSSTCKISGYGRIRSGLKLMLDLDAISRLIGTGFSDCMSSPIKTKMEYCKSLGNLVAGSLIVQPAGSFTLPTRSHVKVQSAYFTAPASWVFPKMSVLDIKLNCIWWWESSSGYLWSVKSLLHGHYSKVYSEPNS